MILECPACKTSHSKSEQELVGGTPISCRRCGAEFRLAADRSVELVRTSAPKATDEELPTTLLNRDALVEHIKAMKEPEAVESAPAMPPVPLPQPDEATATAADPDATLVPPPAETSGSAFRQGTVQIQVTPEDLFQRSVPLKRPRLTGGMAAIKLGMTGLFGYVRDQALPARVAILVLFALPWLLLAVVLAMSLSASVPAAYVKEATPLLVGPQVSDAYPALTPLEQGERVFVHGRVGDFVLVRDAMARAGFVPARALADEPNAASPERPFAECKRAPIELDIGRCQARAQEQFDSCRASCDAEGDASACAEHCQTRLSDCMRTCEGPAAAFPPLLAKEPKLEPEPAAPAADAPDEADDEDKAAKADGPRKKKAAKKKKRGK